MDGQVSVEAYAAGFLEGVLSQPLMYAFEHNFLGEQFRSDPSGQVQAKVTDFLNTNYEWVAQQAAANSGDTYWSTIAVTYTRVCRGPHVAKGSAGQCHRVWAQWRT